MSWTHHLRKAAPQESENLLKGFVCVYFCDCISQLTDANPEPAFYTGEQNEYTSNVCVLVILTHFIGKLKTIC